MVSSAAHRPPRTEAVTACPGCRTPAPDHVFLEGGDRHLGVPGTTVFRRCPACGSVYQAPRVVPEDLPLLYPSSYYTHEAPGNVRPGGPSLKGGWKGASRRRIQKGVKGGPHAPGGFHPLSLAARIRWLRERAFWDLPDGAIPRTPSPGSALEIGPGTGWDLALLARSGWNARGVEWDRAAARVAADVSGCPVEHGDFLDSAEPKGPFRLVFLHHVFEHLPRQEAALVWMADRLHPRGRIVIVVPNPDAVAARRHGRRWIGWDPPRHLCLLSLGGFGEMASRVGLRVTCTSRFRRAPVHDLMSRSSREEEAPDRRPDLPARLRVLSDIFTALFRPLSRPGGDELHLVLTRPSPGARSRG